MTLSKVKATALTFKENNIYSISSAIIALCAYSYISCQINALNQNSLTMSSAINIFQAVGLLIIGFLSDIFCRRKVLLYSQAIALGLLFILFYNPTSVPILVLFALVFSPFSLLKAGLIDNLPHVPKIQIIAISFMILNLPAGLYYKFVQLSSMFNIASSIWALVISLIFSWFFFFDRRDRASHRKISFPIQRFVHKEWKTKYTYTFLAFISAQVVFYFINNLSVRYTGNPLFFSIVSVACAFGALFGIFYKKTPHASLLTINYGLCTLIASIPLICIYIYGFTSIDVPTHLVIFSTVVFFALPFAYDIILSSVDANFRGLTCGILDFFYAGVTILNIKVGYYLTDVGIGVSLLIILLCFLFSTLMQRYAE
ncbi:MAG: hypothetical protein K9M07_04475 [Simkaniaceae bacterium]|nr:hypothetical protein [Simkaniaceae bacterium]